MPRAFVLFTELHASGRLLRTDGDWLPDDAEAVLRLHRRLTGDLLDLVDTALSDEEEELTADFGGLLWCRALVTSGDGLQEIWCALSTRGTDGNFVPGNQRDLLFAEPERHLHPAVFEARNDWPTGELEWWEVVQFGVR